MSSIQTNEVKKSEQENNSKNKEQEKIDHLKEIRVWHQIVGV